MSDESAEHGLKEPLDDAALRQAVVDELDRDSRVDAAHIGVSAKDGAVVLTGRVSAYSEKLAALEVAERVNGVGAVADGIEVKPRRAFGRDDAAIAEEIARGRSRHTYVPASVSVDVRTGHVTLRGTVESDRLRRRLEDAVRDVAGVRGVTNELVVTSGHTRREA